MKKLFAVMPVLLILVILLSAGASAAYTPEVDYAQQMINAAVKGDYTAGYAAAQSRNEKIDAMGLSYVKFSFDDLMSLSKIMQSEAGSSWLSDEWKMSVGEVLLNRVASPEYPNTIQECINQKGQYTGTSSSYFLNLIPSERCVNLAVRLLSGERHLHPSVVYQSNFKQGSGVYVSYYDKYLGWTYLCVSSKPDLYPAISA